MSYKLEKLITTLDIIRSKLEYSLKFEVLVEIEKVFELPNTLAYNKEIIIEQS